MSNCNMYVNACVLLELLECMQQSNINNIVLETLNEVQELILEQEWREINE